jgi:uncharacterized protein
MASESVRGRVPSRRLADCRAKAIRCASTFLLFILLPLRLSGQEVPVPESPTRWVTDTAGFMPPAAVTDLDRRLEAYQQQTGHQLLVYIGRTTGGVPIEDWGVRAFERWQVGRKGIDDGLVLFIMSEDRALRFEVGYGLEDEVPDATAFRIINEVLVPGIRAGDAGGSVIAAMEQIAEAIGTPLPAGTVAPRAQRDPGTRQPLGVGQLIFFAILGVIFLIILGTNPTLAIWLLAQILAGGRHHGGGWGGGGGGWGGGGGGGFRGGGGRSGGGGASGSW